ncbi:MAG: lysine-specific cysteine proteinase Kgp [bacterium P3]|nr:MAG: lysine-specific cysteine proteinase Kgp [bacterium P3]KWW42666.1 MAG: lysine-specific cysteine proteinase Kgp [bacterium F083]
MKKNILFLTAVCMLSLVSRAQTVRVDGSDLHQARIVFSTPDIQADTCVVPAGRYGVLRVPGFVNVAAVGAPMLPVYSRTIEIPLCASVQVEIVSAQVQTVSAASLGLAGPLMPQQPARRKSDTTAAVWVQDNVLYTADTFCGNPVVQVRRMGLSRDRNLAVVTYSPVRYNPATGMVELYSQVDVVLHYTDADISATRQMQRRYHSAAFAPQTDLLLTLPTDKADHASSAPVRYLIVCHSSFRGQMDDFVAWKRRKGFLTDIVYTDDAAVGTTLTSIAAYIKSQYTGATAGNPAPTYLLLVGDVDQIPAFSASNQVDNDHVTDLYYATWTDGDFLPDCYYGRFSAQTEAQLAPQISKTLLYEQYAFSDPSYLSRAILVSGVDQGSSGDYAYTYADPSMDYAAKVYCTAANGYNTLVYYKNNTSFAPAGVTVTGSCNANSASDSLRFRYHEGAGWVNYSAHGSENSWYRPNLQVSHINGLLNYGKPMFMIGNCCLTNHFNTSTCFGEALLRRGNNAGAVAYIGASNSTYWTEDFCWSVGVRSNIFNTMDASYDASNVGMYDLLFHTHGESAPSWRTTAGAIISAGNMAVQNHDPSSTYVKYYWEIYHVMGDPSLEPWLGEASVMPLSAGDTYNRGSGTLQVTAVPYAYVALTNGRGTLVSAAYADASGMVQLDIPGTIPLGEYELVATAQNYRPEFRTVNVVSPSGSALTVVDFTADNVPAAGDTVTFSVRVANLSDVVSAAFDLRCISADMSQLLMLDDSVRLSAVAPHDTLSVAAVFRGVVHAGVDDGTRVALSVNMSEGSDISSYNTVVTLLAPVPEVSHWSVTPQVQPGGESTITVTVRNNGHAAVTGATLALRHQYDLATVQTIPYTAVSIAPGESLTATFDVDFSSTLTPTSNLPFLLELDYAGTGFRHTVSLPYAHVTVIDFETGAIDQITPDMNNRPWVIDTEVAYEGTCSVRSARSMNNLSSSTMSFTYTAEFADSIRFHAKVSSESNGDWFVFSIDGQQMLTLSGEVAWTRYAFPISAGSHTFTFSYQKNWFRSSGDDAVWVDNIVLPAPIRPVVYLSDTVCQNSAYTFGGRTLSTDAVGASVWVDSSGSQLTYLLLTVVDVPDVTIAASVDEVSAGTPVLLTASGASRYEWSTGNDGSAIQVRPDATSVYSVVGFAGQCSASARVTVHVTSGIDDVGSELLIRIYPNPASEVLIVEASALRRVTVYDMSGRAVYAADADADELRIAVRHWSRGVYFLHVDADRNTVVRRMAVL